ncbi:hypothetical protein CBER1_05508 [Cercospora berteroae]|uniref:Tat pathway signal sequence n=1 Tax=Cercospora berteroae TaxID=357750 RepID=A0A2S6BSR7_9PEZI|nr:hypothetical protein CBER1_05508 [Cercospora berteroae]
MDREEERPFLEQKLEDSEWQQYVQRRNYRQPPQMWLWLSTILNIVLFAISLFLVFLLAFKQQDTTIPEPYSPANEAISYEYRNMTGNEKIMVGDPTPAWEDAMHSLLEGTLIRVSQEELDILDGDSVPLKDGGFATGLGVAHNIHCVKKIKQFMYFDYFYPDVEAGSGHYKYLQHHADHCLNFLRQSVMCHMDTSLYTLVWAPGEDGKDVIKHRAPAEQKCVSWDKMQEWMQGRSTSTTMLVRNS